MSPTAPNALKHGLTGSGTALPPDLAGALEDRVVAFALRFRPADDYDRYLVRQLALASVRVERCQELERAQAGHFRRHAATMAPLDRRLAAAEQFRRLAADPAVAVARLRRSTDGCALLSDAWGALRLAAARPGGWSDEQFVRGLELLGLPPSARVGSREAERLYRLTRAVNAPETRESATGELVGFCDAALSELSALSARLSALESSEQSLRESGSWSDPPAELARLRRYEQSARRDLACARAQLEARGVEAARSDDPVPAPEPASTSSAVGPGASPITSAEAVPTAPTAGSPGRASRGSAPQRPANPHRPVILDPDPPTTSYLPISIGRAVAS